MRRVYFYLAFIMLYWAGFSGSVLAHDKQVVGWIEKVTINPGNIIFRAKIDTGAKNCSLNTTKIDHFERNGERWVRFELTNRHQKKVTIESKVKRTAKIKENEGKPPEVRPTVVLGVCLGNVYKEVEVNLTNRSNFIYPMLIGRTFLKGSFTVDPSLKYTLKSNCSGDSKR